MEEEKVIPHMTKQTITYSDGSETVINYRGVIVDGVLIPDNEEVSDVAPGEAAPKKSKTLKELLTRKAKG